MLAEARRQNMLDVINARGFATLAELTDTLGVSESTVRRDLEHLESHGLLRRTHGGAIREADAVLGMPAFEERTGSKIAEKRAIGRAAAELVEDGDSILLDGGTTTLEIARALAGRPVQVVTNSLPIANVLASSKETELILIGGYVYPRTGVALGPLTVSTMGSIRVRIAFLGAGGVMPDGVHNSNLLLVETERAMMACGQKVVFVADHSKFGRLALAKLCPLEEVRTLVTDPGLPDAFLPILEKAGVSIRLAPLGAIEPAGSGNPTRFVESRS